MTAVDPDRVFRSAFDNAPVGMAVLSPEGVVQRCNPAVGALLGRAPEAMVGGTFFAVTHADDMDDALENCRRIQQEDVWIRRHECRFLHADGTAVWVSVTTSRVPVAGDDPAHLVMHIEDIQDRKALEGELRHRALHDPLTGLANRALLLDRIRIASGRPHCLLYLDLDGFKAVNDRFGHVAGDRVLRELGDRLRALLTADDVAARIGGDEFVVLRPDSVPDESVVLAERLQRAVARPFRIDGYEIALTAALGLARSRSEDGASAPELLLDRADRQMYAEKQRSRRPRVRER